jgi:hypothetical protein
MTKMWATLLAGLAGCAGPVSPHDGAPVEDATAGPPASSDPDPDHGESGLSTTLSVNDVSILFPLPGDGSERAAFLWLVPGQGEQGPGFPAELAESLPPLFVDFVDGYQEAMVTSLRFDPCFPVPDGCEPQIRLVAQPVFTDASGVVMSDDSAAHLFYALSDVEAVVSELVALRALSEADTDGPLGVHPELLREPDGAFAAALRQLVADHCRVDNLVRVATNTFGFDSWTFARLDLLEGVPIAQPIPNLVEPSDRQVWRRLAFADDLDDPSGAIVPPPIADDFGHLTVSSNFADGVPVDPSAAASAADAVSRILDPLRTTAEEVDCASCHIATQAALFAARNGVPFDPSEQYDPPEGLDSRLVLDPALQGNLGVTISFGWHRTRSPDQQVTLLPSISWRTVNESLEVVRALTASEPPR